MPWIVGLDEAGYGPNLGPLVQAAVAARVPDGVDCLWTCLAKGVRRASDPDDGRLLIDDSKLVYAGPHGLSRLEYGVWSLIGGAPVGDLLACIACEPTMAELASEAWYQPGESRPIACDVTEITSNGVHYTTALAENAIEFRVVRCMVTPAPRFNDLLEKWRSKAAVLAMGVIELLKELARLLPEDEPLVFVIDKQGGRNFYAAMIQTAFSDSWVVPVRESALCSEYRLENIHRDVRLAFRPRAEQESLPVALASMVAKYLREVFMRQFNRYWLERVPGLHPTAGYPGDSRRFYKAIRPAMKELNMPRAAVWRRK
jgi:ribonuclease HII